VISMMKQVLVALSMIAMLSMQNAGAAEAGDNKVEAMKSQLAKLDKSSSENDEAYRALVLNELPNLIENLELKQEFAAARQLAELKLDTARRLFGDQSLSALDAVQDLIFLSVQQKDEQQRKRYLGQYVGMVDLMRKNDKLALVNAAAAIREERLQRKLKAAQATLGLNM
jgi:hypothetical protein